MNVLAKHDFVVQIEAWCFDAPAKHARGILEEVPVVLAASAVGIDHRHAMTTPRTSCTLPIVRWLRWRVAHQHHVECADVYTHLQRRSSNQAIVLAIRLLELFFNRFTFFGWYLSRMFLGRQH